MHRSTPTHLSTSLILAGILLAAAPGGASAQSGPRIIGVSGLSPLVISQDMGTCASSQCVPAGLPPQTVPFSGGTAYDSRNRTVWVSDGMMLAKVDPRSACTPQCPILPVPNTSPNNPVAGLAYNEITGIMYITDRANTIRWYSVAGGCQLSLISRCIAPVPPGSFLSGCATDDIGGLIFYSASDPTSGGGTVFVAPQTNPCAVICAFPVTVCGTTPMSPLTGLGFDGCARRLWATDGRMTVGLDLDPTGCIVLGQSQCCLNFVEPYIGLCVIPGTEASSGTACTAPSCPNCPTLAHTLGGDPVIGNTSFSLDLEDAPTASLAVLLLNLGGAAPPIFSPPLCAGIRVPIVPPPFVGPAIPTGGPPGFCAGAVNINLPLPASPLICGLTVTSQYIGVCPPGGNFVSNALTWVIGSS